MFHFISLKKIIIAFADLALIIILDRKSWEQDLNLLK
jgi:hypothetical protein